MDAEILYKYPALVDAKNSNEIKEYLKEWSAAISLANSDQVEQIDANSDVSHLTGEDDS